MTRIPETTSQMKQSNAAAADLGVQLGFDPNDSPADGQTPNRAIAKVTLGGLLKQGYGVLLKITTGSASFQNADPGTNGKAITLTTGAMGRVTANFTDTVAEQGSMTATVVTGPGGSPIANGPSDTEPYVFAPAISDVYSLDLKALVDGALANGKSTDQGEAIVTDNGGSLASPVIVRFEFTKGAAKFVLTGDANIQPGSSEQVLYVKTQSKNGKDIAKASFTDSTAAGETVTLKASLQDHPEVQPATMDFSFAAVPTHDYALGLNKLMDGAPADGKSTDQGEAIVTDNGGSLASPVIVRFEFTKGAAKFVLTGDANIQPGSSEQVLYVKTQSKNGKDIANASFTDSTAAGEAVTLKASLPDHQEVQPATQDFSFAAVVVSHDYGLGLNKLMDGAPADGKATDLGVAVVTDHGEPLSSPVIVRFEFTKGAAKFVLTGDANIQPGSTDEVLYVQTHSALGIDIANAFFTDSTAAGETVTLKASLRDYPKVPPKTLDFSFAAVVASHDYVLGLNKLVDGASADGKSTDQGEAIVTDNGGSLASPVIVRFEFTKGAAKFVLTGDANIQPGSSEQVLYVKTQSKNGKDIADASFTDSTTTGETVTLEASLRDYPDVPPQTRDFTFQALALHDYAIVLLPQVDNAPADGKSDNLTRVLITDSGINATDSVVIKCEFTSGSANFDLSNTQNVVQPGSTATILYVNSFLGGGLDFADIYFTDTVTEVVTLKVSLRDYPAVTPQTHDFTFTPDHPIQLYATRNNARAYSDQCNSVLAFVGDSPGTLVFTLPASSSASFVDSSNPKSKEVTVINGLAEASFTSIRDEDVTLTATMKGGPLGPGQLAFTFRSDTFQYDLSINMSGYAGTAAGTNIYFSGLDQDRHVVRASLPVASSATFPAQQTGSYWMINPKLCEAHIQTATTDQVTRWVDVVNADGVAVCACAIDVPTKASVANVSG